MGGSTRRFIGCDASAGRSLTTDRSTTLEDGLASAQDRPALVLGEGLTALGVTRCLARRGVPVCHLAFGDGTLVGGSRWYRPVDGRYGRPPGPDGGSLAEALDGGVCGPAVLFPCDDALALEAASLDGPVRERFPSWLAPQAVIEGLVDKTRLAEIADRAGVPHPGTTPIGSVEELQDLGDRWFVHSLLKPADSLRFFRAYGRKSVPVSSREEAIEGFRRYGVGGTELLLQRYVPGPPSAHLFLDGYRSRDGETKGLLVRRRERMFPPVTGSSSSTITVPPAEGAAAAEHLDTLLSEVDFHGIFSAEFKEDAGDGTTRLLEVNVRPWWYVEFAARCGVDVCWMAYREALGQPVDRVVDYDVGRRCIYPYKDLFAGWGEMREGRLGPGAWLRSWVGSDRAVFAWDDPVPALRGAWDRARGYLGRRLSGGRGG